MTGWRIGWIAAPPALGQVIENLIQYSTSGVAAFMQRGAVAALEDGEDFVAPADRTGARRARDRLRRPLRLEPACASPGPTGAFYLFFTIDGLEPRRAQPRSASWSTRRMSGSRRAAPSARPAAPFLRLCFLRKAEDLREATQRLRTWLGS